MGVLGASNHECDWIGFGGRMGPAGVHMTEWISFGGHTGMGPAGVKIIGSVQILHMRSVSFGIRA